MNLLSRIIVGKHPGPDLLVTGGVHGDEFEPMAACRCLLTEVKPDELHGRLTIVPVVNEPAFRRGQRTGHDGLDLARTCPGRPDGTATEQIAFALSQLIRSADYYIDLHTGGTRLRVLPLAGYTLHADPQVLDAQRRMANAFGLPLIWGTDPNLDGRSLSVARDAKVPAIYAEYHGCGGCDPDGVAAYVQGCLNVMASLKMIDAARRKLPSRAVIVEDQRPGAGHMQINHPSPSEGFFEPAVQLAQTVEAGQPFGTVVDPLGERRLTVPCAHRGVVLVLHTFARVEAGESLGVILEQP